MAVGKCLTVRPVAWKKRGLARHWHVPSLCFTEIDLHEKEWRCPRHRPSSSKEEKGSRNSEAKPQFGHRDGVIPCDRCCNPWVSCLLLPPGGWVGMQVKILTRTMKVKSEHHKFSGSSSAKAQRVRAANLPSHRLSEIQRSEVLRSAGGKLSPIEYSCQRKPASINETIISFFFPSRKYLKKAN